MINENKLFISIAKNIQELKICFNPVKFFKKIFINNENKKHINNRSIQNLNIDNMIFLDIKNNKNDNNKIYFIDSLFKKFIIKNSNFFVSFMDSIVDELLIKNSEISLNLMNNFIPSIIIENSTIKNIKVLERNKFEKICLKNVNIFPNLPVIANSNFDVKKFGFFNIKNEQTLFGKLNAKQKEIFKKHFKNNLRQSFMLINKEDYEEYCFKVKIDIDDLRWNWVGNFYPVKAKILEISNFDNFEDFYLTEIYNEASYFENCENVKKIKKEGEDLIIYFEQVCLENNYERNKIEIIF